MANLGVIWDDIWDTTIWDTDIWEQPPGVAVSASHVSLSLNPTNPTVTFGVPVSVNATSAQLDLALYSTTVDNPIIPTPVDVPPSSRNTASLVRRLKIRRRT